MSSSWSRGSFCSPPLRLANSSSSSTSTEQKKEDNSANSSLFPVLHQCYTIDIDSLVWQTHRLIIIIIISDKMFLSTRQFYNNKHWTHWAAAGFLQVLPESWAGCCHLQFGLCRRPLRQCSHTLWPGQCCPAPCHDCLQPSGQHCILRFLAPCLN